MNRVRQLRNSAGLTIKELSELVGVSTKSVRRHEKDNEIHHYILRRYAYVFQVSMEFILGAENNLVGLYDKEISLMESGLFKDRFKAYNYEKIDKNKRYYLIGEIHEGENIFFYIETIWKCFTEDNKYEKRVPRLFNKLDRTICEKKYGRLMIINSVEEVFALWQFGGYAIIEEKLCEQYFSNLFEEGILVKRKYWDMKVS